MSSPFLDRRSPRERSTAAPPRWRDEAHFIKTWLENPRGTGAVSPSSRALSRALAREVDPAIPGPVIELGPGTGPVTEALIRRGIAPERLILVEFEGAFCKLLARRYPQVTIVQGDAYALCRTLQPILAQPAAAIVSSLPLLNRPDHQRLTLLAEAFSLMRPGSPFVQFTYGMVSPIPRHDLSMACHAHGSAPVWLNLPPARVWTYRSRPGHAAIERLDLIDRLRAEWLARSAEARAEWRARAHKVKTGLAKRGDRRRIAAEDREPQGFDRYPG